MAPSRKLTIYLIIVSIITQLVFLYFSNLELLVFVLLVVLRTVTLPSSGLVLFRTIYAFSLFLLVTMVGTLGYQYLEEWTLVLYHGLNFG